MARPLAPHDLSLTGAGVALVTSPDGTIEPDAAQGLVVDDRRVLSRWTLDAIGATVRRVGWQRTGPSSDRLVHTVSTAASIDPIAVLERHRHVSGSGLVEHLQLTAYAGQCRCTLWLTAERDDQIVFHLGDTDPDPDDPASTRTILEPGDGSGRLLEPGGGHRDVTVEAPGWHAAHNALAIEVDLAVGETWQSTLRVHAATDRADEPLSAVGAVDIATTPRALGDAISAARHDLRALTMPVDRRDVLAAGSPFFLALFGRDSMIAGMQFLIDSHRPLLDILGALAHHQATTSDASTGAEPGRILHELRVGRSGVFGLPPGAPYYGAVDTSALFVVSLGEAARWGAPADEIAALVPAARDALRWCAELGDVDGDGFVESVPHATGLTNLGWKDSADSIVDPDGNVIVGRVALCEVQAYWYRALRDLAAIERWLGLGDGAEADRDADALRTRFLDQFVYDTGHGPFVGLALDPDKRLLGVRTSNAGHVLWSGVLPHDVADSVASQLIGPGLFSGWGIRTLSADAPGYNPFGYHRGSVWPHDTALAMLGAARIGRVDVVRALGEGLLALATAHGGQLPELVSGLSRADLRVPVPYTAACRPQAWSAGALLMVTRALLGLEPDVPAGTLHLNPCLDPDVTIAVRNLELGDHTLSFKAAGADITELHAPTLTCRRDAPLSVVSNEVIM